MTTPVKITSLDFNAIKTDIKTFLGGQTEFTDFDFDGSGMSVLLDILAYVTHTLSIQANMSFNELYLDTATLRNTVISKAKELNYIPKQKTASVATITLSVTDVDNAPSTVTIPKGTKLNALKDNVTYFFTTTQEEILVNIGSNVYSKQIEISQGEFLSTEWTANNSIANQEFIIQDENVDIAFLEVQVKQIGDVYRLWRNEKDITSIVFEDDVWFYQEGFDKKIQVYFGDGVIGEQPVTGEKIKAEYLVTEGYDGNGINNFQLSSNVGIYPPSDFTIVVDQKSQNGTNEESIERIKLLAPKSYEAQNRAVTTNDYRSLLIDQFPFIQTMNVWGGEDNVPAIYGKVFMVIKPTYGTQLSPQTILDIESYIKRFNIVGIQPQIMTAEYIYVNVISSVKYKGLETSLDDGEMITFLQGDLETYITDQSANFGDYIYYSNLVQRIDDSEPSIVSNLTSITLSAKFKPSPNVSQSFIFEFSNALKPGTFTSTYPGSTGNDYVYTMVDDKDTGFISLARNGTVTATKIGTIDYDNGIVTIAGFSPDINTNTEIELVCEPLTYDLLPSRRTLLIAGDMSGIAVQNISNVNE